MIHIFVITCPTNISDVINESSASTFNYLDDFRDIIELLKCVNVGYIVFTWFTMLTPERRWNVQNCYSNYFSLFSVNVEGAFNCWLSLLKVC